ncbi:hypothetical protein ES703_41696 [subsurface metagenome]
MCAIEIGRLLSADQIVLGTVGKVADLYYLTVKIIDVQTGRNLIAKKEQDESLSALVGKLDSVALLLAGEEEDGSESNKIVHLDFPEGRYEGTVKAGKPNGQGTYYYFDTGPWAGDRYEGEFRDDKASGQGTFYFAGGARYEGEFRDGIPNGRGTFYSKTGDVYTGTWADGKPIGGWLYRPNLAREWVTAWWF